MPLYQVVILALIQSVTEFLPISSTAHLALAPWLLGWKDPGLTFDIALHVGTLAAIVLYFFRDWLQILAGGFGLHNTQDPEISRNPRLLWLIAAATVPVGAAGFLFNKQAEGAWRNPFVMGTMLIVIGVLMWVAERVATLKKNIGDVSWRDAIDIGLSQALAVVPGTSRSGITISTGLFRNLDRPAAARFSFLLATPALAAAAAKAAWDLHKQGGIPHAMRLPMLVGILVTAVAGWVVIANFLKFLRTHSLRFFVYYRIIFGIIVIALAIFVRR
jgi:undecaprenyl-diphosphatase